MNRETGFPECECRELTEEILLDTLMEGTWREAQEIAGRVGLSKKGSKLDIINRVKNCIVGEGDKFNKIFRKMFGYSGGWLTSSCIPRIIYAVKFLLRSESPRDFIDILQSLKYKPNEFINDMAYMVA